MVEIKAICETTKYCENLKVIIFDLDDTLFGEKEYVKSGYSAVSKILPQVKNAESKLWKAFEEKKSAIDEVLQAEGIFSDKLKEECLITYRYHKPNINFYDGVVEMLESLRKQDYNLGVITDGRPEGQNAKIKALGLDKYVDHIIITDELGGIEYRKPNEKAFILMKERFGVEFSEMCYVGDNIIKDFIAPKKLGMKVIWFNNSDGIYYKK